MAKNPDEIGTLWYNEWNGKQFFKGTQWEVPSNGMTVELIPFSFQKKDGSGEARGMRVIRVACKEPKGDDHKGDEAPPF